MLMASSIVKLCYMSGHVGLKKGQAWGRDWGQWLVGNRQSSKGHFFGMQGNLYINTVHNCVLMYVFFSSAG
jgi:hypothetical protein